MKNFSRKGNNTAIRYYVDTLVADAVVSSLLVLLRRVCRFLVLALRFFFWLLLFLFSLNLITDSIHLPFSSVEDGRRNFWCVGPSACLCRCSSHSCG